MAGSAQAAGSGTAPGVRTEAAREVLALRNLVAVYRHLSGLAVQNADIAAVTQLIAEQTDATVADGQPDHGHPDRGGSRARRVSAPRRTSATWWSTRASARCSAPPAARAGRCACPGRGAPPR